jgi:hypothetical protein
MSDNSVVAQKNSCGWGQIHAALQPKPLPPCSTSSPRLTLRQPSPDLGLKANPARFHLEMNTVVQAPAQNTYYLEVIQDVAQGNRNGSSRGAEVVSVMARAMQHPYLGYRTVRAEAKGSAAGVVTIRCYMFFAWVLKLNRSCSAW